jgi:hypothetical protein
MTNRARPLDGISNKGDDEKQRDQEKLSVVDDERCKPEDDFVQTTDELQKLRTTDAFLDVEHDEHRGDERHGEPCVE